VAVADLLEQNGVMGDFVPVNLRSSAFSTAIKHALEAELTSFRHFCLSIAKRKRVMALSFADMVVMYGISSIRNVRIPPRSRLSIWREYLVSTSLIDILSEEPQCLDESLLVAIRPYESVWVRRTVDGSHCHPVKYVVGFR
jgi:hypothetical protein